MKKIVSALALCLITANAQADGNPKPEVLACSARNSVGTTVEEIARNPEQFEGRCVAVDGVKQGVHLFGSVDGVYQQPADVLDPSSNGARLGLDNLGRHYSERFQPVSIIGRVQDCETVRACAEGAAGEDVIIMVSGYCHSWNGAYLWVEELRKRRGAAFERRMGEAARPGYGDLEPAPENWPHRSRVESLAAGFLSALRASDREKLLDLHFRAVGLEWEDDERELVRFLLHERGSPFEDIRKSMADPQQLVLIERRDSDGPANYSDPDNYSATVCFCREADCTGRWPIATFDADNERTRPYACTEIRPYLSQRRMIPNFHTAVGRNGGLLEPQGSRSTLTRR